MTVTEALTNDVPESRTSAPFWLLLEVTSTRTGSPPNSRTVSSVFWATAVRWCVPAISYWVCAAGV